MDELSPLFHDIEFKERFRGYDVEEVDAYIDRVAKAAALVQGRIAELQLRVEAAEAAPRAVTAVPAASTEEPAVTDEASLTRMLMLAQRTADAAVEEARAEAEQIRRQADDHASLVLAEAETDRRRMQAEAEASVEEAIRSERERVTAEVAELERYRAFLSDDIAILEAHLERSREALQNSVAALQHLVEAPEQFRTPAMPETSGIQLPADLLADTAEPEVEVEAAAIVEAPPAPVFEPIVDADPVPAVEADPEPVIEFVEALDLDAEPVVEPFETEAAPVEPAPLMEAAPVVEAEPVEAVDEATPVTEPEVAAFEEPFEPVIQVEPVATEAVPEISAPENVAADPVAEPEAPAFDPMPQGSEILWADDTADADALTFDPGPMPQTPPSPLPAAEADVVDLTDEAIVLEQPITAPTPTINIDEPVTGEWSDFDTGTHTAIAPPLLVTAADLEEAPPAETDWIDDLRIEAGPATEQMPTIDEQLLFADPEPAASSEAFLEQLRDAVNGEASEEFGEDALAAFFDDGEDDGRSWFNRRR